MKPKHEKIMRFVASLVIKSGKDLSNLDDPKHPERTKEFSVKLGALIRKGREDMELSQKEMSEKSGVSVARLRLVEQGTGAYLFDVIDVAVVLGIDFLSIVKGACKPKVRRRKSA
jgi:ribosome-binding protein aMBF1 (putative translation factor)